MLLLQPPYWCLNLIWSRLQDDAFLGRNMRDDRLFAALQEFPVLESQLQQLYTVRFPWEKGS